MSLIMDPSLQTKLSQFLGNTMNKSIDEQTAIFIVGVSLMSFFFLRFFFAVGVNAIVISFAEKQRLRLKDPLT